MKRLLAVIALIAAPAVAQEPSIYAPMLPFEPLAGRVYRGEGTGPDGKPIVDIAEWEMILGGRALQSTHKLEGGTYGGRTIFFYDEAAKAYVFHYFTTAGFHTTGTAAVTETGFVAMEEVVGHPEFASVRSEMILEEGGMRVVSVHVRHDGTETEPAGFVYRETGGPGPSFD